MWKDAIRYSPRLLPRWDVFALARAAVLSALDGDRASGLPHDRRPHHHTKHYAWTMTKQIDHVEAIFDRSRMIADGIPYSDVLGAEEHLEDLEGWFGYWSGLGDDYEARAAEAESSGHRLTAGELFWQGSLSYHYAQFMWFHDAERRQRGQDRKVELYNRAAPLFNRPGRRVEIPFATPVEHHIPGFLRLPAGEAPPAGWPCALLIGGTESTKEESYRFENLLLIRGVATFAFDGPGQGEMWRAVKMQPRFERWTSAVTDHLIDHECTLDVDRLGVLGRSLGGHMALRSAATDQRLKVAVAWGAFWDYSYLEGTPVAEEIGNLYIAGYLDDPDTGNRHLREIWDLSDVADDLTAPTLILQGAHDVLFTEPQNELLRAGFGANAHVDFVIEPDGAHCCHNIPQLVRPRMADFLADHLVRGPR